MGVRVFVSYAHEDRRYLEELKTTFADLQREGVVDFWTDELLQPGDDWLTKIRDSLKNVDVIVLLLSRDFLASEFIHREELRAALERHKAGAVKIIPIVARPCDWEPLLGSIQAIPQGGPISKYPDPDDAWLDVRKQLKSILTA